MITFYKSQKDVAKALKLLVDEYWELRIEEVVFIEKLNKIVGNNEDKIFKEKDFTTLLKQRLGKKRVDLIQKVLEGDKR